MSTPINPTYYVDPKIADIRNSFSQKADNTPYLLMPLRIETRFMKVTTTTSSSQVQQPSDSFAAASMRAPEASPTTTEELMESIGGLNIQAVNTQTKLSGITLRAVTE